MQLALVRHRGKIATRPGSPTWRRPRWWSRRGGGAPARTAGLGGGTPVTTGIASTANNTRKGGRRLMSEENSETYSCGGGKFPGRIENSISSSHPYTKWAKHEPMITGDRVGSNCALLADDGLWYAKRTEH